MQCGKETDAVHRNHEQARGDAAPPRKPNYSGAISKTRMDVTYLVTLSGGLTLSRRGLIMQPIHLLGLSLLVTLSACTQQQENATDTATSTTAPAAPTTTITSAPMDAQAPSASTSAVTDPNPPHGEPGHRCEIPVGASLSGTPPSSGPVDQMPTTQQITMPQMGTQPATGASLTPTGMNPPHGEPGHDCAVAVGSPLPK